MEIYLWRDLTRVQRDGILARPHALYDPSLLASVSEILDDVKVRGDAALFDYTEKFDGVTISDMRVPEAELELAWKALPEADKEAMTTAKNNIAAFHEAQKPDAITMDVLPGLELRREFKVLESVGLYVPGGTAPLVSTLMMLAIPARIAGVSRRVVMTPPGKNASINEALKAAAYLCDISEIYMAGGAQAIGALAYGTETIPRCVKIFGPGNAYVAAAKAQVSAEPGGPAIDLPAGPSEAMVMADDGASAVFVAADLLSQAEHDPMAQVICVLNSRDFAYSVQEEIRRQIEFLPRKDIAWQALDNARFIIAPRNLMADVANAYAPEHLIINVHKGEIVLNNIINAGSIFMGPWTPEALGDYASGTNHVLPTGGAARAYSGVTTESFMKSVTIQTATRRGLGLLGPHVERLARMEGLEAHRQSVRLRLEHPK